MTEPTDPEFGRLRTEAVLNAEERAGRRIGAPRPAEIGLGLAVFAVLASLPTVDFLGLWPSQLTPDTLPYFIVIVAIIAGVFWCLAWLALRAVLFGFLGTVAALRFLAMFALPLMGLAALMYFLHGR